MKKALICGISGQDGAYLAQLLLKQGYVVCGTSRDAQMASFRNLVKLGIRDRVQLSSMALRDFRSVVQTLTRFDPDEVYNLAGQSSVGLSFEQPVETLESIATGTLNLLEAIRFLQKPIRFYNAGSSECFGCFVPLKFLTVAAILPKPPSTWTGRRNTKCLMLPE